MRSSRMWTALNFYSWLHKEILLFFFSESVSRFTPLNASFGRRRYYDWLLWIRLWAMRGLHCHAEQRRRTPRQSRLGMGQAVQCTYQAGTHQLHRMSIDRCEDILLRSAVRGQKMRDEEIRQHMRGLFWLPLFRAGADSPDGSASKDKTWCTEEKIECRTSSMQAMWRGRPPDGQRSPGAAQWAF